MASFYLLFERPHPALIMFGTIALHAGLQHFAMGSIIE